MTLRLKLIFLFSFFVYSTILRGQERIAPDKENVKNLTDTINLFFQSDSIDIYIDEKGCWVKGMSTIIKIRKYSDNYTISYVGGEPNKKYQGKLSINNFQKIKKIMLELPSQPIRIDESNYLQVYFQICNSKSEFAYLNLVDYTELIDKKVRKIIGLH